MDSSLIKIKEEYKDIKKQLKTTEEIQINVINNLLSINKSINFFNNLLLDSINNYKTISKNLLQ
jgi:hypothetical protein